jgi:hypothetical protein
MKSWIALLFTLVALVLPGISCRMQPQHIDIPKPARGGLDVEFSRNTGSVPKYEVFEITFRHETAYTNPFFDVTIDVVFTSPSKKQIHVGGFHYGSSSGPDIRTESSQRRQVSYHFKDHHEPLRGASITFNVPKNAGGYWYSPENAAILQAVELTHGHNTIEVPEFTVDIALLITPDGPPDIDEDGVPDHEELDIAGDGFDRAKSVPWDAFPLDKNEWLDTDGDCVGDNADDDDDSDGFNDQQELRKGTDPLNKLNFPER